MVLAVTSEQWIPTLPGQPAVTLELQGSISMFVRHFYHCYSILMHVNGVFTLTTLPFENLLVSPLYLFYNIKLTNV